MNNYLTLTKVLLKTTLSSVGKDNKKKWLYLLLAICFIPSMIAFIFMFKELLTAMQAFSQEGYVYSLGLQSASLMVLLFSAFLVPSVYYFSKDIDQLLSLPLTSECIIASKFTVCVVYEYLFIAMILIPLYIAFFMCGYTDLLFWIVNIIVFITLPIFPLVIDSVIIVLMMRFVKVARRKDLYSTVGQFLLLAICLGISLSTSSLEEMDANQLAALLMGGNNSLLDSFNYIFPHITFISQSLFMNKIVGFIFYLIVNIVILAVFFYICKLFYLKGAISIEETSSKRVKLTGDKLNAITGKKNVLISYTIKELKILFRTPAYLMNCISIELVFPIAFGMGVISGGGEDLIEGLKAIIPTIEHLFAYMIIGGFAVGIMASNTNMVSATSLSREGKSYIFMKYIPVPLRTILNAKVLSGFIIAQIMIVFVYIGLAVLFPIPLSYLIMSFVASELGAMLGNYIGIIIDVLNPNFFWEDETTAVKRSVSGMISMFSGFGLTALAVILCIFVPSSLINIVSVGLVIISLFVISVLFMYIDRLLDKSFRKL